MGKTPINKYKLGEEPETDTVFWKQKTPLERIQALEALRQQYINLFFNGVQLRFQRVYKVVKRQQS